jgi:hypothetical protein
VKLANNAFGAFGKILSLSNSGLILFLRLFCVLKVHFVVSKDFQKD